MTSALRSSGGLLRPLRLLLSALAVMALVACGSDAHGGAHHAASTEAPSDDASSPLTGAILLDLDDDADDADRAEIARLLDEAIAPHDWRDGSLGEMLSDPAELYVVNTPPSEVRDVLQALRGNPLVEAIERERTYDLPDQPEAAPVPDDGLEANDGAERHTPNDPYYRHQWHLDQIQMPEAWTRAQGRGVVVAVIDTGVLYRDHEGGRQAPDLANTRFVDGYDFVDDDAFPDDEHGHGTHVAGTVAQSTNNALGVAGVAPQASIMPIRVLDARGGGSWGRVAAGIRWAADHGADVINLSLGGGLPSSAIRNAIRHAHARGVVVVAAAGNTGRGRVEYPAAHRHVIAVGAVRYDRERSFYSSYGEALDIAAPGGDLRVDQNGDGMPDGVIQNTMLRGNPMRHDYLAFQGTSMAAPHVAGVAALLRAQGVTDPDAIERILKESADDRGDALQYGAGVVQARAALDGVQQGRGTARGGLAAFLALLALVALRRRKKLAVPMGPAAAAAFFAAGGFGLLALFGLRGAALMGPLGLGLGGPLAATLGATAAIPIGLAAIAYGAPRARPLLAGVCFGAAAWLGLEALQPTLHTAFFDGALRTTWLMLNAAVAGGLGWLIARR